jgi:hypothetical protein
MTVPVTCNSTPEKLISGAVHSSNSARFRRGFRDTCDHNQSLQLSGLFRAASCNDAVALPFSILSVASLLLFLARMLQQQAHSPMRSTCAARMTA